MGSLQEVKGFFAKLREEQIKGVPVHILSLRNSVSFSEKVLELGEFTLDTRKGSKLSLAAFLYLSNDPFPPDDKIISWYSGTKGNKALLYSMDLGEFEARLASGRIEPSNLSLARLKNSEGTFVEFLSTLHPFSSDKERKDTEPYEVFIRLVSGGVKAPSRATEYEICKKIAESNGLSPLIHHGGEVKGVWLKPARKTIIGYNIKESLRDFIPSAKALREGKGGEKSIEMELRNADHSKLPESKSIEGLTIETSDDAYDYYRIVLTKKHVEVFMSLFSPEIETVFDLLSYYGFSSTPRKEVEKPKPPKKGLPVVG